MDTDKGQTALPCLSAGEAQDTGRATVLVRKRPGNHEARGRRLAAISTQGQGGSDAFISCPAEGDLRVPRDKRLQAGALSRAAREHRPLGASCELHELPASQSQHGTPEGRTAALEPRRGCAGALRRPRGRFLSAESRDARPGERGCWSPTAGVSSVRRDSRTRPAQLPAEMSTRQVFQGERTRSKWYPGDPRPHSTSRCPTGRWVSCGPEVGDDGGFRAMSAGLSGRCGPEAHSRGLLTMTSPRASNTSRL